MKVLTVASDTLNSGFFRLKTSCALHGLELVEISNEQTRFITNRSKDDLLSHYLSGCRDEEIVLFSDGYDTLLLADEEEILDKFYRADTDLLVSAEANCFPEQSLAELYPVCDTIYRYLNCGGFIGRAGAIKEFLSREISDPVRDHYWSNQYIWTLKYLQNTGLLKLDTHCEVFCTFYTVIRQFPTPDEAVNNREAYLKLYCKWFQENFIVKDARIYNKLTGTWPCTVHFNGVSSLFLDHSKIGPELLPGKEKKEGQQV